MKEKTNYYIRFGKWPEDERSGIYSSDQVLGEEQGVSVFDLAYIDNKPCLLIPVPASQAFMEDLIHFYREREAYLVTGKLVGLGSNGEPLIVEVELISEINVRDPEWQEAVQTQIDSYKELRENMYKRPKNTSPMI